MPIGVVVASLALTYFFCLRPMRRGGTGSAAMGGQAGCCGTRDAGSGDFENELARTRAELADLQAGPAGALTADAPQATRSTTEG